LGNASPAVIATVKAAAVDKDARLRRQAFLTWADIMPDTGAEAEQLAALLLDADVDARFAALRAWDRLYSGMPQAKSALVRLMKDADLGVRRLAVDALAVIGAKTPDEAVINALEELLASPDGRTRVKAALALMDHRWTGKSEPDAEPAFAILLNTISQDESRDARRDSVAALSRWLAKGPESIREALRERLHDKDPGVRCEAAFLLLKAGIETSDAEKALLQMLRDEKGDPMVRGEAVNALARAGEYLAGAGALLVKALGDDSAYVRECAASALVAVGIKSEEAVAALQQRLDDGDAQVRLNAAVALLARGAKSEKVLDTVRSVLRGSNASDQQAALSALGRLLTLPKELSPALEDLANDPEPTVRRSAVLLLVRQPSKGP
jgi:HEAT repeat protein